MQRFEDFEETEKIQELVNVLELCEDRIESNQNLVEESSVDLELNNKTSDEQHLNPTEIYRIQEILNNKLGFYEDNAINYFAGVIARHVMKKYNSCDNCKKN